MVTGIPSAASTHAMLEMIIGVMGIQEGAPNRRSGAIVRRPPPTRGLIVVDEAQHLTSAALDELRSLHDAAEIGLALVGNETVFARIDGGGRKAQFAQVFSRIGMRIARAKSTARDVDALLDAAGIAGAPERKLLRAIASKPGALRAVAKTLRVAHMLAAEEGAPIAESHLLAAWERLSDDGRPVEAL
jgi:DNA transposition AAA+ family ATPase